MKEQYQHLKEVRRKYLPGLLQKIEQLSNVRLDVCKIDPVNF